MIRPDLALPPDLASDRARALALTPVSRETSERLDVFVALLLSWQRTTNLVAASTIPHLWTRHIADSLQLLEIVPGARTWADLGSGGGFPGLVRACARVFGVPALVHASRIEDFVANNDRRFDVVTARALAPLANLLQYAFPLLKTGAVGVFPKGQDVEAELTAAS